jgi:D-glycero-D-manno-heptose 1,7-bisphosphate phosphatase
MGIYRAHQRGDSMATNEIGMGPAPTERPVKLLVVDLDGTVRKGFDELGRFVNGPEDVEVFPEARALLKAWKASGGRIIAASNQGGIAMGHTTFDRTMAAMVETHRQCGGVFDKIQFCRHHPQASDPEYARCWCRKPSPGIFIEAAVDLARAHREFYPPWLGLFVGDREEDEQCAKLAGLTFKWAKDWRAEAAHGVTVEVGRAPAAVDPHVSK